MTLTTLQGVTLATVEGMILHSQRVEFTTVCGRVFEMIHCQDCCETVALVDVCGDVDDLVGTPIIQALERSQRGLEDESSTWTFYTISTIKGTVDLRWLGVSNGYYSERVDFREITSDQGKNPGMA
jgi:hypothetical protein